VDLQAALQVQLSTKALKQGDSTVVGEGLVSEGECNRSKPFWHLAQRSLSVMFLQRRFRQVYYTLSSSEMPMLEPVNVQPFAAFSGSYLNWSSGALYENRRLVKFF
jgi:hypothetical protein